MSLGRIMKRPPKLRCFVASALGHSDVDAIYDQVIVRVMNKENIAVSRVDRVEHNDDIDEKILELMNDADFCLADLTYARPSVYFEAGYVQGLGKPVIYMARSDHFRPTPEDAAGNQKIHFDLQMKNIIAWTKPNVTLARKLTSRTRLVTKPLRALQSKKLETEKEERRFSSLSQRGKIRLLAESALRLLRRHGFTLLESPYRVVYPDSLFCLSTSPPYRWVFMHTAQSLYKTTLMTLGSFGFGPRPRDIDPRIHRRFARARESHIFCVSVRRVPASRVQDALPDYVFEDGVEWRGTSSSRFGEEERVVHVIAGVRSVSHFQALFKKELKTL